jgi:hypothetical protein
MEARLLVACEPLQMRGARLVDRSLRYSNNAPV